MSRIVLVHGIGQQVKGPQLLLADWYPALCDGLTLAGATNSLDQTDVTVGFYGDIFRRSGGRALDGPLLDSSDVTDSQEAQWLRAWWEEAARLESAVKGPNDPGRFRTPYWIQRALDALCHSSFFVDCSEHMLICSARQVRLYFTENHIRNAIRDRIAACVTRDTRVIVAHSLGSVVAYEAMCANSDWRDITLVTLGSPLGIRNLVFDRLDPPPVQGKGCWPQSAKQWTNIADRRDVVAINKRLATLFEGIVVDILINNGARAHDVRPYLTARETGQTIARGLS